MLRNTPQWLPSYVAGRFRRRGAPGLVHVMFCFVDHFEPDWGGAGLAQQVARVERWARDYPAMAARHADADGRPPQHTFFYPAEVYESEVLERVARLCRAGYGEIEVHLHHCDDTTQSLRQKLEQAKACFSRHGALAKDKRTGAPRFGFIHGNWTLDNAGSDGKECGVNDELRLLRDVGCYADFTLPSAPSETQTRKINSIYYATDDPARPKSHDTGDDVRVGCPPRGDLMIIQGPLTLNWRRRKYGVLPRIENGDVSASHPPSPMRTDLWVRERIGVRWREEWVFVKVHTHGAKEDNAAVVLGRETDAMYADLETRYNDGTRFRLHYVTARELYNIVKAAEAGESGDPGQYRDYLLMRGTT